MRGGGGGEAGGSARGGEEGAGRHGALAPTSKGQGRKRWLPDIKGRAGDREGGGAPEVNPAGTVGKAGSAEPGRGGGRSAGSSGTTGAQLGRAPGTPEKGDGAPPLPPARRGSSPVSRRAAGSGVRGPGRGAAGPSPKRGERPGLSYSAFSWKRPWRQNGWWRWPGPAAPPAAAPLLSAPRPGRPEGGSRGQVTPARAVGAGAHPRAAAAETGFDGGAGRAAGLTPASPAPSQGPARVAPGVGRWVGDAGCLHPRPPPPSRRPLPRG